MQPTWKPSQLPIGICNVHNFPKEWFTQITKVSLRYPLIGFITGPVLVIVGVAQCALNLIGMLFSAIPSLCGAFTAKKDLKDGLNSPCTGSLRNYPKLKFSQFSYDGLLGLLLFGAGLAFMIPGVWICKFVYDSFRARGKRPK